VIWQDKGGFTTQWIDDILREHFWEITQSISIINKQGTGPEQCNLLFNHCVTRLNGLASKRPLGQWFMPGMTNLDGEKLMEALGKFWEVGLRQIKSVVEETSTLKRKLVHVGVYFTTPMLLLRFPIMCRY